MKLAVIGTGYVALVTAAGFADFGNDVACVGSDPSLVSRLENGELPLYEPGLQPLCDANRDAGRIRFTTDLEQAVRAAEVVFLAQELTVGDGGPDLAPLFEAADRIGRVIDDYKVIVVMSTVPVGTADRLVVRIGAHTSAPFAVVSSPSFLKEGDAVGDFMKPDRVVLGTSDARGAETVRRLYGAMLRTRDRIFVTDARSAELAKYASSALLASRISFMNELAVLAEDLRADIETVRKVMGADPRIGPYYLFVGPGFGGPYFSNDLSTLLHTAREVGRELRIARATEEVNRAQRQVLVGKLRHGLGDLGGKVVAIWGLAFKPQTDDVGQAPALALIDALLESGAQVRVHDPRAMERARRLYGDRIHYGATMYDASNGADALVLVTEWHAYRRPDFQRLASTMRGRLLVDGRNIWEPVELRELGFRYLGIGRA